MPSENTNLEWKFIFVEQQKKCAKKNPEELMDCSPGLNNF